MVTVSAYGVAERVEAFPLFCHTHHVAVVEDDERLMILISRRCRLSDDDTVLAVTLPFQTVGVGEAAEEVGYLPFVVRRARDGVYVFEDFVVAHDVGWCGLYIIRCQILYIYNKV